MIMKPIIVLHRYLGVAIGLIMTMWCLSGFVMMYQSFPETTQEERLAGLSSFDLEACCDLDRLPINDTAEIQSFRIEPVGNIITATIVSDGAQQRFDLTNMLRLDGQFTRPELQRVTTGFAEAKGITSRPVSFENITYDQWSVYGWKRQAPIWRAEFEDDAKTLVYVSGKTGQVFQDANAAERFLSWFGAIPHWLYPSLLRANQSLWYQSVIWLAALGIFLVATGIVVGVVRLRGRSGRYFPYRRRMWYLHHVFGFFAGLLVLSWVTSGLLTMQPWGLLESPSSISRDQLVTSAKWSEIKSTVQRARNETNEDLVQIRLTSLLDSSGIVMRSTTGAQRRFTPPGTTALDATTLTTALNAGAPVLHDANIEEINEPDAYYYGHKTEVPFPVYRVTLNDSDKTRLYIDTTTAEIRRVADGTAKRYRWFESALHTFDFPFLQSRPLWDLIVLPLLAVVTFVCFTGTWLAFGRVKRDLKSGKSKIKRWRT